MMRSYIRREQFLARLMAIEFGKMLGLIKPELDSEDEADSSAKGKKSRKRGKTSKNVKKTHSSSSSPRKEPKISADKFLSLMGVTIE